jgi:hypothetical protein
MGGDVCAGGRGIGGTCGLGLLASTSALGGGATGRGDGACGGGAVGAGASGSADTGGAVTAGLAAGGIITRGAGTGGAGGFGGVATGAFATGAAGFTSGIGGCGTAGRAGGGATADCFWLMAFSTSPGLEIWDKSILVLMPSVSGRAEREDLDEAVCASALARKWARTFSASWSSRELECVFFSVTPTSERTSRIALLFTSSSLARSLIRILLIRVLFPPPVR